MEQQLQVFPDLAFQGRLRNADDLYKAEILFFVEQLQDQGEATLNTPNYCLIEEETRSLDGQLTWLTILLKLRGTWKRLFLQVLHPGVLILYDRRRG